MIQKVSSTAPSQFETWLEVDVSLGNVLPKEPTKDIVVCVKHWSSNYRTYGKKVHQILVDTLSIFSVPRKFACQTPSRKVDDGKSESESIVDT